VKLLLADGAIGLGVAILAACLFIRSGLFDVAASKPHSALIYWIVKTTMIHSVKRHARGISPPAPFTAAQAAAGFCAFETHCVMCHGALSVGRQTWVNGMTPDPPYLADAPQRWTPGELFWIIRNGVKMTAMPAWQTRLSERDTWNLVAFLEGPPNRQPGVYVRMRAAGICPRPPEN
jgi:mono/diheme cytochrome c family protein